MSDREKAVQNALVGKMYRILQTMGEMCTDRGYDVPAQCVPATLQDFRDKHVQPDGQIVRDNMTLLCRRASDGENMFVFFNGDPLITSAKITEYHARAANEHVHRMIIVHAGKVNAFAKKTLDTLTRGREGVAVHVETFEEDDVVVNITKHELVPKHEPMTEAEAKEMLAAHSLELSMLPRILSTDPVARYFGLRRGQVMKITRNSETAGTYTTYRQVI